MIFRRAGLSQPGLLDAFVRDAATGGPDLPHFIPDFFGGMEVKKFALAHSARKLANDLPIGFRLAQRLDRFSAVSENNERVGQIQPDGALAPVLPDPHREPFFVPAGRQPEIVPEMVSARTFDIALSQIH
jgi:hypothetical protein